MRNKAPYWCHEFHRLRYIKKFFYPPVGVFLHSAQLRDLAVFEPNRQLRNIQNCLALFKSDFSLLFPGVVRSVYGGFVQWQMGQLPDGADSLAVQLASAAHWPQLR